MSIKQEVGLAMQHPISVQLQLLLNLAALPWQVNRPSVSLQLANQLLPFVVGHIQRPLPILDSHSLCLLSFLTTAALTILLMAVLPAVLLTKLMTRLLLLCSWGLVYSTLRRLSAHRQKLTGH